MSETQTAIPEPTPDCTDCNDSDLFESVARELYQTAALFVGDENEAMQLVEETVASVEMDPCADGDAARSAANRDLVQRALARVAALRPAQMHPSAAADLGGCVETDDLSAAGITRRAIGWPALRQLAARACGSGWRDWGRWSAAYLCCARCWAATEPSPPNCCSRRRAIPWTETHVGGAYRAALCSLASSLVHSAAH